MYCSRCGTWVPDDAEACARCGMERRPAAPAAPALRHAAPAAAEPVLPPRAAVRYGGVWRRFAGVCVDTLLLYFPNAILRELAGFSLGDPVRVLSGSQTGPVLLVVSISFVIYWWYCAGLESSRWQGTLGQQLLGLRVADLHGRRISFLRATGRNWAKVFSVLLCMIGYLFNLWTSRRQTLHDLVAGCVVVRAGVAIAADPPAPTLAEQAR